MKNGTLIAFAAVALVMLFRCGSKISSVDTSEIPTDRASIVKGQALFKQHCVACHPVQGTDKGPSLAGLTSSVSIDWIKGFIKSPKSIIESGDERAQMLIVKYNEVMPAFDQFQNDEMDDLLAFLHTQKATRPGNR